MATRKTNKKSSSKKTTRKSSPKTTQVSDVEHNLDKHPRPVEEYLETSEDMIPMGEGLDQHPRPVHQMETEIGFTSRSRTSLALFSSLCIRSSISATGSNGDENNIKENGQPTYIGNYHKGLKHNGFGEVIPASYQSLLTALNNPTQANFANIQLGLGRKLTNPQSGLATDLEGPDPKDMLMRSAPSVRSAEAAAEAVELYWMALLRDVPFTRFNSSSLVATAAQELSTLTDFTGPKVGGQVTPQTIFRGCSAGVDKGPYLSQFMLKDIPYGSLRIIQRQRTVLGEATLGVGDADYLTDFQEWLAVQNGATNTPPDQYDGVRRYIRDMRDLGEYVHVDALYEA